MVLDDVREHPFLLREPRVYLPEFTVGEAVYGTPQGRPEDRAKQERDRDNEYVAPDRAAVPGALGGRVLGFEEPEERVHGVV